MNGLEIMDEIEVDLSDLDLGPDNVKILIDIIQSSFKPYLEKKLVTIDRVGSTLILKFINGKKFHILTTEY